MYIAALLVYFISYITRINYNTVLVEISSAENISRSMLALPLTSSFITYGLGQIISGWLGDRFDPFRLISLGVFLSAIMNILLPAFPKPYLMTAFWAVNGFAQALVYPPLMKIGKYEKSVAKSLLKKLLSLNLIDENEFRTLADNINLDIEKKLCVMHS